VTLSQLWIQLGQLICEDVDPDTPVVVYIEIQRHSDFGTISSFTFPGIRAVDTPFDKKSVHISLNRAIMP
jgi:hypothetical protein